MGNAMAMIFQLPSVWLDPAGFAPKWGPTGLLVLLALALAFVAVRGASATLRRWQRWLLPLAVLAWAVAGWRVGLALLSADTLAELGARALLCTIAMLAALPLLRDLVAGVAIALEGLHRVGDEIRIGGHEGRIQAFGLRSVILRERDGTEATVPNRVFASSEVERLTLGEHGQDAPTELEISLPPGGDLEAIRRRLLEAALLSPYAAPGRRPEVFAVADARGELRLRLHAFVFDRSHEERYRGDVLARAELI
jgi:hypothetical protein